MKLSIFALLAGLGMLVWLLVSQLSSDAIGMALGVIFGILAGLPGALLAFTRRQREELNRWDYQDGYRAGQRDALPAPQPQHREAAYLLAEDEWLADCLDAQAQIQLGMTPRQITERNTQHVSGIGTR